MLLELSIKNIALIEALRIEFAAGFNVLTGETGAGKSIIVDSLNLALGGRADRELIRTGADKASVQALFDVTGNDRAIELASEMGAEPEDGLLAISRELSRSGRNICRVNGVIVPLASLKALTALLMDIHGQHEHQALSNPERHADFLDSYGGSAISELKAEVESRYLERMSLARDIKAMLKEAEAIEREAATLGAQADEIHKAKLKIGEEEALKRSLTLLENAEHISTCLRTAYSLVYSGDSKQSSAQALLSKSRQELEKLSDFDERFKSLAERLADVYYQAQDIGYELQSLMDANDFSEEKLQKVLARLDVIDRLETKYGATIESVIAYENEARAKLGKLSVNKTEALNMKKRLADMDAALKLACERLTGARRSAADELAKKTLKHLAQLGMKDTRFEVDIRPRKIDAAGADDIEFIISPNPGEPLKPLAAIASGGELSRIMLAMKAVSADLEGVDSMVFDEIDAGVSGRMAQAVGEKICTISQTRQVLCVTHLPQIAALGDRHFIVEKHTHDGRTDSHAMALDRGGRIRELSRLVGGASDSESSLKHAEFMLDEADSIRRKL